MRDVPGKTASSRQSIHLPRWRRWIRHVEGLASAGLGLGLGLGLASCAGASAPTRAAVATQSCATETPAPQAVAPRPSDAALAAPASPSARGGPDRSLAWVTDEVRAPRVHRAIFESASAGGPVSVHVYLPRAYDDEPGRRFPTVYWLHGMGGGLAGIPPLAARHDRAIAAGLVPPHVVVFVNGLESGMYCDSKDGRSPVESMIVRDLVPWIDANYRTVARREGRILDGFSMGGYGAARLGFAHVGVFGAVSMAGAGPLQPDLDEAPRLRRCARGRARVRAHRRRRSRVLPRAEPLGARRGACGRTPRRNARPAGDRRPRRDLRLQPRLPRAARGPRDPARVHRAARRRPRSDADARRPRRARVGLPPPRLCARGRRRELNGAPQRTSRARPATTGRSSASTFDSSTSDALSEPR